MKRDYSLDLLRVISMVLVIMIHVSNYYCRGFARIDEATYLGGVIFNGFARVSVPIFFMISGALLIGGRHDKKKYWSRLRRLTGALVAWNIIYYLWNYFYMGTRASLAESFVDSFFEPTKAHLWFMYAIIGLYLVMPFAQSMMQKLDKEQEDLFIKLWLFFSGGVYILRLIAKGAGFSTEILYNVPIVQGTYYFGYFAVGYLLYKRFQEYRPGVNKWCLLGLFGSSLITITGTFAVSLHLNRYYESLFGYRSLFIIIASLSVFVLVLNNKDRFNDNKSVIRVVNLIAPASFGVYLFHVIPLNVLLRQVQVLQVNSFIGVPLFALLLAVVSLVVIIVIKKIPGSDKLLGI